MSYSFFCLSCWDFLFIWYEFRCACSHCYLLMATIYFPSAFISKIAWSFFEIKCWLDISLFHPNSLSSYLHFNSILSRSQILIGSFSLINFYFFILVDVSFLCLIAKFYMNSYRTRNCFFHSFSSFNFFIR